MPAGLVESETVYPAYTIVGTYVQEGAAVVHVALLAAPCKLGAGKVAVLDMGPPLRLGRGERETGKLGEMEPHVFGWAPLTPDEEAGLARVIADLRKTVPLAPIRTRQQLIEGYIAVPPYRESRAENGTLLSVRFSCAGLALYCYSSIGLALVDLGSLPQVTAPELDAIWMHLRDLTADERQYVGLPGPGPWKVLLPGYLFHAFGGLSGRRPWRARRQSRRGEWTFPSPP
jgi:hypothetical protein